MTVLSLSRTLSPGLTSRRRSILLVRRVIVNVTVLVTAFQVLEPWGHGQAPQTLITGPSLAIGGARCRSSSSSGSSSGSAVTSKQGIALRKQPAVTSYNSWRCMLGTRRHLPEGLMPKNYR